MKKHWIRINVLLLALGHCTQHVELYNSFLPNNNWSKGSPLGYCGNATTENGYSLTKSAEVDPLLERESLSRKQFLLALFLSEVVLFVL